MNRYDGQFGKVLKEIIFPDGVYRPPTPCDEIANAQLRQKQQKVGGYTVPGSSPMGQPPFGARAGRTDRARRPEPDTPPPAAESGRPIRTSSRVRAGERRRSTASCSRRPPIRRITLRFAAAAPPLAPAGESVAIRRRPTAQDAIAARSRSRDRGRWWPAAYQSIGRMPYERYGFSLLPGWNGVTGPTSPEGLCRADRAGGHAVGDRARRAAAPWKASPIRCRPCRRSRRRRARAVSQRHPHGAVGSCRAQFHARRRAASRSSRSTWRPQAASPRPRTTGRDEPPGRDLQNVLRDAGTRAGVYCAGSVSASPNWPRERPALLRACKEEDRERLRRVAADARAPFSSALARPAPQARLGLPRSIQPARRPLRLCASRRLPLQLQTDAPE